MPFGAQVITILQRLEDRHSGNREIPGAKCIASFWWSNDGPGPVSWDGDDAIYEVAGFWLSTSGGDSPEAPELVPIPSNPAGYLFNWLDRKNSLELFLLKKLKSRWDSQSLLSRLEREMNRQSKFVSFDLGVSENVLQELVDQVRNASADKAALAEILESKSHPMAEKLVEFLEEQDDLYWLNLPLMHQLQG